MKDKPKQLDEIDLQQLREIVQDYIDFVDSDDYCEDNDYSQYIAETAIQTIFGKEVWEFINKKLRADEN